jgi:hypothetical protein
LQADQARSALEKLKTETDLVAQKFNTIFKDSFADSFASFIDGSKSAKEAFADFASSVASQITRLATQELANGIFGSMGGGKGGGGIGGLIGGLFGGGGGGIPVAGASGAGLWADLAALIPGFAVGTDFVPRDMVAMVHRGERIVPANENMSGGGGSPIFMTVVTPDAGSFRASKGQTVASMAAALSTARRDL